LLKKQTTKTKWANDWPEYKALFIRCIYHTRLIVNANGKEFTFNPGETKEVEYEDAPILLAMRSNPVSSCCGGTIGLPHNYFELA
jgi:hypothetical protein